MGANMVATLTTNEVLKLVKATRNRRETSLKILQYEIINGRPKMILQVMDTEKVIKELTELGYTITKTTTSQQISATYKLTGEIKGVKKRNLHTTNLVVKW